MESVGRYRLVEEVARGGSGVVLRALAPDGRQVALKLLVRGKQQGSQPLSRRRVETEVQSLLRLRHPHVVQLLDAGEHEGTPYLVMEWVAGETLAARLERVGSLDPRDALRLALALASALEYCHGQGVLHRDLKPENVLLRTTGQPLLTDFGLAKDVAAARDTTAVRTVQGSFLGTPGYWAPELALGEVDRVGPASDVYGLGALLFAALTGTSPQEGRTIAEQIKALERPPRAPSSLRPGLPPALDAVCLSCLATDPGARYADMAALARDLQACLDGRPLAGPKPAARPVPGWFEGARAELLVVLVALLALLSLALVAGLTLLPS